jgi:uncharacterized protein (DUF1501 family)
MIIRKTSFDRRSFVKSCFGLAGLGLGSTAARLGQLNAAATVDTDYKALVCVFLFGGNDSNQLVVPASGSQYNLYSQGRGTLAIPASNLLSIGTHAGQDYGMSPRLPNLRNLFSSGKAALILNAGVLNRPMTRAEYRDPTVTKPKALYSHNDQTAAWNTASPALDAQNGWCGRLADSVQSMNLAHPITNRPFPVNLSVSGSNRQLDGVTSKPTVIASTATTFGISDYANATHAPRIASQQQLLTLDTGVRLVQESNGVVTGGIDDARALNDVFAQPTEITWAPTTNLGRQLRQVARVIEQSRRLNVKRQIFFVGVGGYDTHEDQATFLNTLYTDLDNSLSAFQQTLDQLVVSDKVVLFTESEFNRTFTVNSSNGSDHAWGGHHIVMGAPIRGSQLYGRFPALALNSGEDAGNRGYWIPSTSMDQYGATMAQWFGVQQSALTQIFPNLANFPQAQWNLGFV